MKTNQDLIGDRQLWVSVSGGKDSTATALHLRELGLSFKAFYLDTGWESAHTLHFLREVLPSIIGCDVQWVRAVIDLPPELEAIALRFEERMGHYSSMVRLILKKGMFPSRQRRTCTKALKVHPSAAFFDTLDVEPISVVGIRAEESKRRSMMTEWEWLKVKGYEDVEQWRPIIGWTLEDVIAIHKRHGAPLNPLYKNATRVGCWPCIYARKSEIRALADGDPDRIDLLEDLEAEVTKLAIARAEKKGETLESRGHVNPGFFVNPAPKRRADGTREGNPWPIRKVVRWANTAKGKPDQFDMFPRRDGCMRWGYCEASDSGE